MNLFKTLLVFLGTLSLCLGVIGIIVPGLPTTPFLLLTAGLYIKCSHKLYQKLVTNRFVGPSILVFQTNKGMTKKVKIYSICIMWIMIIFSTFFLIRSPILRIIVLVSGFIGTIIMGKVLPTIHISNKNELINML